MKTHLIVTIKRAFSVTYDLSSLKSTIRRTHSCHRGESGEISSKKYPCERGGSRNNDDDDDGDKHGIISGGNPMFWLEKQ